MLLYCKTERPGTHLSGRVRSKITFAELFLLEITFAELYLHLSEDNERVGERHVTKVTSADRRSSSGGGTDVYLTAPVALCEEFIAKYVGFKPDAY